MKKLGRVAAEKKIAGVCAGLGAYFDADPLLFRLIFLVSLLFGGVGLLAYLVMWLLVPLDEAQRAARATQRLHLSAANRKIGGVCGGLGEFFDLDPVLFRAGFVVFAFACGAGILLYIALWLLMPRASAAAQSGAGDIAA